MIVSRGRTRVIPMGEACPCVIPMTSPENCAALSAAPVMNPLMGESWSSWYCLLVLIPSPIAAGISRIVAAVIAFPSRYCPGLVEVIGESAAIVPLSSGLYTEYSIAPWVNLPASCTAVGVFLARNPSPASVALCVSSVPSVGVPVYS